MEKRMEKKICVILTGGTIGSKTEGIIRNVTQESSYVLIEAYKEKYEEELFEVCSPFQVLSENFTMEHWTKLSKLLREKLEDKKYQGIIIAHGTDTLSYTSALLGLLYKNVEIPVVLVASNHPIGHAESNGLDNFYSAVQFIKGSNDTGVFVAFQDKEKKNIIYLAEHLVESDSYEDQFSSYVGIPFGEMKGKKFIYYSCKENNRFRCRKAKEQNGFQNDITFQNDILLLRTYPGFSYDYIQWKKKPRAILHYLYHSGTACVENGPYSLTAFLRKCKQEKVPVYLASLKNPAQEIYDTTRQLVEAGGIPLYEMSVEKAYAAIAIAYNQAEILPEQYITKNFL